MDDEVETLAVDVRANTQGFAQDIAAMKQSLDATLVEGFVRAGDTLERGLLGALKKGSLGFEDLRRIATRVLDDIAAQALDALGSAFGGLFGGSKAGIPFDLAGMLGAIFGLPGRATGGNVSPGRGYLVGERGPELFVPTAAGRVEPSIAPAAPRTVNVSIRLDIPRGVDRPQALQRSGRQVAAAVRKALENH